MTHPVHFDRALIRRYDIAGPRYTSYPTAPRFHEGFDAEAYRRFVAMSNDELIPAPLSLYVHLPFCRSLCYYCACTKKITRHAEHGERYLESLTKEIEMQGRLFDRDRPVRQLHFGGGTPTFFEDIQIEQLMARLRQSFSFDKSDDREFSIELDPRTVDAGRLAFLADTGFNRVSVGVQDIDPEVQQAVNRVQDTEHTLGLVDQARRAGIGSVSMDLIYGLPLQTPERFTRTLEAVAAARPDRLAVYSYAHMPNAFRAQRLIRDSDLPTPETKLELMELAVEHLTAAGYVYIGMDHFALPEDELAVALTNGSLQRNFQGYSTRGDCDLIGLGVSAIGKVGDCYAQNIKEIPRWADAVDNGDFPIWRGYTLNAEDRLRRGIIEAIMCRGMVEYDWFENRFDMAFDDYFAAEIENLRPLEKDGLINIEEDRFTVTPAGRLLLRAIAMVFDAHLTASQSAPRFSRVI
ncbi:oxygen-independent coproporphyrinogen III oxidase [Elongatibacter sediminis]|uniref:Coproporphyrinogen-III oxidase n=1 Tax=Elongatibacter sediminis TaxID=3119006 RepID=A0AAW9R912_9GAMM